jgi:hypothetical protein
MPRALKVTAADIALIERLAGLGLTLNMIAHAVSWSTATLDRKLKLDEVNAAYRRGRALATEKMASRLWDIAMQNDELGQPTKSAVAATIFWLKAQANWSETPTVEAETLEPIQVYLPDNARD